MKLDEFMSMSAVERIKRTSKIIESKFGYKINFDTLSEQRAKKILSLVNESIQKIRTTSKFHQSEKNPRYMELLMIRESIVDFLNAKRKKSLYESEIGQAEVFLASKEIVDELQEMVEKVGRIQNEKLPALKNAIRDRIGAKEAESFVMSVNGALKQLVEQLVAARDESDKAVLALSGEEPPQVNIGPDEEDFGDKMGSDDFSDDSSDDSSDADDSDKSDIKDYGDLDDIDDLSFPGSKDKKETSVSVSGRERR